MKNKINNKKIKPEIIEETEEIDGWNRVQFHFGAFSINMESEELSMEDLISKGKTTISWFIDKNYEKVIKKIANVNFSESSLNNEEDDESETPPAMFG